MALVEAYVAAEQVRLVQRQIQHRPVLEFELYGLFATAVGFELRHSVVAAYSMPEVHDVVAFAQLGEVEKLVDLRPARKHSAARLEARFLPPAEELPRADKRRARCAFGEDFPIGAQFAEVAHYKPLAESGRHKRALELFSGGLENPPSEPLVAAPVGGYEHVDALFRPLRELLRELYPAARFGLKPVPADLPVGVYGGDSVEPVRAENLFFRPLERFRRSFERRHREKSVPRARENLPESAVADLSVLRLEKQVGRARRYRGGLEKYPVRPSFSEVVERVPRPAVRSECFGNRVYRGGKNFRVRKLRVGVELPDCVDFVAEKVDSDGGVGGDGVDVQNPAARRELPGRLAEGFVVVSERGELFAELARRDFHAGGYFQRNRRGRAGHGK